MLSGMTNSKYGVYVCAAGDLLFYDRMIRRRHLWLFAAVTLSALSSHDITELLSSVLMDREGGGSGVWDNENIIVWEEILM